MSDDAIVVEGLVKTFGSTRALDGLDLRASPGSVHGFVGPNGAGKSTAIRVLLGLLRADGGTARVLGSDPWTDSVNLHRRLAYVPGDVALWPNLTGGEAIDLFAGLRGRVERDLRDELVERFALDPTKRCSTYSKGNRQKVALIAGFASDVELYLLDEPTSGLDPLMAVEFQNVVRERAERGSTVLLSSHVLAEVEALCEEVTIIRDGRTVESGSLADMRHLTRTTITVRTESEVSDLGRLDGVHNLTTDPDGSIRLDVDGPALATVHRRLAEAGVVTLTSSPPSLEQIFLRHYDTRHPPSSP